MSDWNRRRFMSTAAIAAGGGLAGWNAWSPNDVRAQTSLLGCILVGALEVHRRSAAACWFPAE